MEMQMRPWNRNKNRITGPSPLGKLYFQLQYRYKQTINKNCQVWPIQLFILNIPTICYTSVKIPM